jgi:hypothetical protein
MDEDFFVGSPNFSSTRSSIDDGSLYFGNVNAGARIFQWRDFEGRYGFLDILAGYQWWQEEYEAFGLSDELGFGDLPPSVKVITETWTWQSARIGARALVPFPYGFTVRGGVFYLPWSQVEVEDRHHLRPDLQQNPSIVLEGTGGSGWQAEVAVGYTFWKGLGIEAGYRFWEIKMDEGDISFRGIAGTSPDFGVEEIRTRRHGFFGALYYRF